MSFNAAGQTVVVVSDHKSAVELLGTYHEVMSFVDKLSGDNRTTWSQLQSQASLH